MRRSSSLRIVTAISCVLCAAAAWRLSPSFSSAFAAQAQTAKPTAASPQASQGPRLQPASASIPADPKPADIPALQPAATAGTGIYTAKRGEAIPTIARRYLSKTSYLTSSELAEAIRHVNGDRSGNILKANENIVIPGILPAPIVEKTVPVAKDFEVRAIYLTGIMAGSDHGLRIIRHWREVGGNAVVFDIKDSDGSVTIPFEHPLLGKHQIYLHDVPKFVHFLHQQNMHAIARIAIFRDERLVTEHPELAVQSRRTRQPWRENGKLVWTDPSNPKVQEYNIALARHVAQSGADEIQFDYVRFPAEGDQKDALFVFQSEHPEPQPATSNRDPASNNSATANNSPCGDGRPSTGSGQALGRPADAKQGGTTPQTQPCSTAMTTSPNSSPEVPALNMPKGISGSLAQPQTSTGSLLPPTSPNPSPGGAGCESPGRKSRVADKNGNKSRRDGTSPAANNAAQNTVCRAAKPPAPQGPQRSDVITAFLKKAYAEIHPTGALFSLDVFGVMAWQRPVDLSHTGQDIVGMAKYCDVLSPMIYPSHFFGMDNIARPGDAPEHFIGESMDRFELITKGSGVVIRPWLQAFHWRTKTYSPEYIKVQVMTARNKGGIGFLFWNAGNDYSKPFTAMPEMRAANAKTGAQEKDKYFRGDELPTPAVRASLTPSN